jgi:hypothetical protein
MAHEFETDRYSIVVSVRRVQHCAHGCAHMTPTGCAVVDAKCAAWRRNYKLPGEMPDADAPGCPTFKAKA